MLKPLLGPCDSATEEWRNIPGYPGYQASSLGRVRSLDRVDTLPGGFTRKRKGRVLRGHKSHGYVMYTPSVNSVITTVTGHKLVMLAFAGPPKDGEIVCHYDGDRSNNAVANLRYGTHKDNEADKERHGTRLWGETANGVKLTEEAVVKMRELRASGYGLKDLAQLFSVGMDTISLACVGKTWTRAGGPISPPDPRGSYPRPKNNSDHVAEPAAYYYCEPYNA